MRGIIRRWDYAGRSEEVSAGSRWYPTSLWLETITFQLIFVRHRPQLTTQSHPTPLTGNYDCDDGSWELTDSLTREVEFNILSDPTKEGPTT